MTSVTLAATQMACSGDRNTNIRVAEKLVREAQRRQRVHQRWFHDVHYLSRTFPP